MGQIPDELGQVLNGYTLYPLSTPLDKAPMTAAALVSAFFVRFA